MRTHQISSLLLLLPLALLGAFALSCDGGGGSESGAEPGEDTSLPDAQPVDDAEEEVASLPSYPDGPFGVTMGETIEDLGFYDPETEELSYLRQWYQHPKVKLLMLISTAAW